MTEVELAAVMLTGALLLGILIAFAIWRARRPAKPSPSAARVGRLPKRARKDPEIAEVEIAPARLARISGKAPLEPPRDGLFDAKFEADISAAPAATPAVDEVALERCVSEAETAAQEAVADDGAEAVTLFLVPQIPLRDAVSTRSWLGGRPRLASGATWPQIDGQAADFLAQIDCSGLPRQMWDGLGPRHGALAFFIHRHRPDVHVLHVGEPAATIAPPYALNDAEGWFGPYGGIGEGDLASFAVRAFPQWPVDLVAADAVDADAREADGTSDRQATGYDIADPAFHPFDWGSLTAMAAILEARLDRLVTDPAAPDDADAATVARLERCAAINREARARALEIVAIIHDSAVLEPFSVGDATAVMAALHAIQWAVPIDSAHRAGGEPTADLATLPLTTHRADADLWVHDYRTMLFDRAKHAWCADPANLSGPARAYFEPLWRNLAAREMATVGGMFDQDPVLLALPTSGLMSRRFGDSQTLVVTIARAALAIGDFTSARAQLVR
ncbi:MAG: DUF1963 domain-containing protein [Sphingopyxis sp.]|uniref:DUF1963 domain-containing protein n=1 Tax=Sphingopyxis sp. TaxID=1908224 RepID=UPI0032EB2913